MSEQDRSLRLAGEHPFFSLLWLGSEALDVGERGPMADQDALELSLLRKPVQPVDEIGAERFARSRQGGPEKLLRALRRFGIFAQPSFDVASDANHRRHAFEHLGGLTRPWAERGVVAAEQEGRRSFALHVGKHGLECGEVAVDVVQQRYGRPLHVVDH